MSLYNYSDLFNSIPIKDAKEAERIINTAFAILCYLKDGEEFTTSFATFSKISSDLIHVSYKKSNNMVWDELQKNSVAKIA